MSNHPKLDSHIRDKVLLELSNYATKNKIRP